MEWMNYHHLLYFWTVVREGSISTASEHLRVSSPAISAQLRSLEENFGEKLLSRSGRNLVLTEMGRTVFRDAEDILGLGRELTDTVDNRPTGRPRRAPAGESEDGCCRTSRLCGPTSSTSARPMPKNIGSPLARTTNPRER